MESSNKNYQLSSHPQHQPKQEKLNIEDLFVASDYQQTKLFLSVSNSTDAPSDEPSQLPSSVPIVSACHPGQWKKTDGTCAVEFCDACPSPFACDANTDPTSKGLCYDCGCGWCRSATVTDPDRISCCKEGNGQQCTNNSPMNCLLPDFVGVTGGNVCATEFLTKLLDATDVSGNNRNPIELCSCHNEMDHETPCGLELPSTPREYCFALRNDDPAITRI